MSDLTETQKTILQTAIERTNGSIHPLPERIKGGAAKKVLDALKGKGFIDEDGTITQSGLDKIDPDWTSIYAIEMCAAAKKEADEAIRELAMALDGENNDTTALANDDATTLANNDDAADMATNDDITPDTTGLANNDDVTDMATSYTTKLANDDTTEEAATSDKSQDGWTDEPDPEILALAKKHFPHFTQKEWPAIRNTIEEAYSWGFNDAKAKPKRQTSTAASTGTPKKDSKQATVIAMLKRPEGATTAQIAEATGWQQHTIRGFISIAKKKLGLEITTHRTRVVGPNKQGSPGSSTTYFVAE